jgi:glycosyltransferase involved in cell wall biosynthesis
VKLISIVTPCYNEEANVEETYRQVKALFEWLGTYRYEHVFIDNASTDNTQAILRRIAAADENVRVIINSRNFGHVRSPYYAVLQTRGDAVIPIVADLQDPIELIPMFLQQWEEGRKIVMGVKTRSEESRLTFAMRKAFYGLLGRLSEIELTANFYGFGLYDRVVIEAVRQMNDPYPYWRGMVAEVGFEPVRIPYVQRQRKRGKTSNSFYSLYDVAMLGVTSHSKIPLRAAVGAGFCLGALSLAVGMFYLVYKLAFWDRFQLGMAPLVIGIFFFSAVQLFFIGILGEYIGAIHTQVVRRPLVVERERINFDAPAPAASQADAELAPGDPLPAGRIIQFRLPADCKARARPGLPESSIG